MLYIASLSECSRLNFNSLSECSRLEWWVLECLSLPRTVPVLALKVPYPGKPLSPKQIQTPGNNLLVTTFMVIAFQEISDNNKLAFTWSMTILKSSPLSFSKTIHSGSSKMWHNHQILAGLVIVLHQDVWENLSAIVRHRSKLLHHPVIPEDHNKIAGCYVPLRLH